MNFTNVVMIMENTSYVLVLDTGLSGKERGKLLPEIEEKKYERKISNKES